MVEKSKNISRHRLLIGFSSIILLFIAFGVTSFFEIRALSKVTRTIYNHPLVVSNASLRATVSMIKMHRSMKDVALFDFPTGINTAINEVNEQERMVFESLDTVKENILGDEGQKLENETRHLFVSWKPIREEVIKLVSKGQRKEAAKITMRKGADYVAKLENKMFELSSYARNRGTGFMRHGEKVRSRVVKTTIILMSIGVFFSIFIAFFTVRKTQATEDALKRTHDELEQRVEERTAALTETNEKLIIEIEERQKVEENLKLQNRIVENMAEGVFLIRTSDGMIVYANETFDRMFGYDHGELINKHVSTVNAPSEKDPKEIANDIMQSLKEKGTWSGEVHNIKKDGSLFWCNANVSTLDHQDFGEVWISVHEDISERKKAEEQLKKHQEHLEELVEERTSDLAKTNEQLEKEVEIRMLAEEQLKASLKEKEVLLREIHHRVKNNMQVIISLLKLQSDTVKDKQVVDALINSQMRLQAMASIHETLYSTESLAFIDFETYTSKLARTIFQTYGACSGQVELNIEAEDIKFGIDQATPIGLIVNELISNSLKHGFPENRKGEISIRLKKINDDKIELVISDNGIGMPEGLDWRNTDSLGLQLVTILAEGQLDGGIDLDRQHGTKFVIRFKLENNQ